jgi:hypothetical protein
MNYKKIDACKKLHVVLDGAQGRHQMYALREVQVREGDKRRLSLCHHKSDGQTTLLHTYHTKVEMVVPVRRYNEANEVPQGRET